MTQPVSYGNHPCPYHGWGVIEADRLPPCNFFFHMAMDSRQAAADDKTESQLVQQIIDAAVIGDLQQVKEVQARLEESGWAVPFETIAVAATERGRVAVLEYCFQHGNVKLNADINKAAYYGSSPELYQLLWDNGWDRSGPKQSKFFLDCHKGKDIVQFWLGHGVKPGSDILVQVASAGDDETVQLFFDRKIKLPGSKENGLQAMQKAAQAGRAQRVEWLLSRGVPVNGMPEEDSFDPRECRNATALHRAVERNHIEVVRVLLKHGADPTKPDEQRRSAIEYAEIFGYKDILQILKESQGG